MAAAFAGPVPVRTRDDRYAPGARIVRRCGTTPSAVADHSRYHASRTGGPWGFSVSRGGADDWRSGCFEWSGWDSRKSARAEEDAPDVWSDTPDLYRVLGVPRFSSLYDVRRGYRAMARKWHPDTHAAEGGDPQAGERFMELRRAVEILTDPVRKAAYDEALRSGKVGSQLADAGPRRQKLNTGGCALPECELAEFVLDA